MKQKFFTIPVLLLTFFILSSKAFAQEDSGGLDTGDGTTIPPEGGGTVASTYTFKSFTFKRNNGNGLGVCGMNAQIRVVFDPMPATLADIPELTSVLYKSTDLIGTNYIKIYNKEIIPQTQPYISYCVQGLVEVAGAHDGNIPPAEKLTLKFNNQ